MRNILARIWARRPGRGLREFKAHMDAQSAELNARWDKWVSGFRWEPGTRGRDLNPHLPIACIGVPPDHAGSGTPHTWPHSPTVPGTRNPAHRPSGRLPGSLNAPKRKPQFIPIDLDESMRMLQIEADALVAAIRTGQPF